MKNLQIKKHLLTGISFMLPLVVAAGLCIAIGQIIPRFGIETKISEVLVNLGVYGMNLLVPVFCASIAYSIADKPGIAPGLVLGYLANEIKAGFLGGILFGFVVGFVVLWLKKNIKVPKSMEGLVPVMLLPLLSIIICGLGAYFIVGVPIVALQNFLLDFLVNLDGKGKFLTGAILGGMVGFDFGGPVNKTASIFVDGLLLNGIYGPEAVKVMVAMVPPLGLGLSVLLTKNKYTKAEIEGAKVAFPMGLCMITEGVIPIAARDPIRVIAASTISGMIAGGLSMLWNVGSSIPSGGVFIIPFVQNPLGFIAALIIGSCVMAAILSITKKVPTPEEEEGELIMEEDMNLDDFEIESL
ncbi:MAG: PTS fructose transporter subunit IIC [Candidatus Fusobacterium pullicola]|uniref:PTS fructose transporter subunit IIC n=1 Tax=Candidatus Fusobacterium pullicola TaxID=2838601 RepID=A0A9E2NYB3_9FUSO|nr:PTS fructose transporter subunit IIC [Candidatus Fusobacterium pullicola]